MSPAQEIAAVIAFIESLGDDPSRWKPDECVAACIHIGEVLHVLHPPFKEAR